MIRPACISVMLILALIAPLTAQEALPAYDYRERTRALAFDPNRFFPDRSKPAISVRYMGDDYDFPVYAIAVRRGCTDADHGEARRTCGDRLIARMVRSPFEGQPPRARARGQRLFATIAQSRPRNDGALLRRLDSVGLEWLEADVRNCPAAMNHLATGQELKFSPALPQMGRLTEIVLHADKVSFEIDDYLTISRYEGWLKPGSPGAWANDFATSLEKCWKPSIALVPWRVIIK